MPLYLLDANVVISAHNEHYPIDRIPGFWLWLCDMAENNKIKMPRQIYDEVCGSGDALGEWLRDSRVRAALLLNEVISQSSVNSTIENGYGSDITDVGLDQMGADPFLIAAAATPLDRVVVTRETSAPSKTRHNRKIPDVCRSLGIRCIRDYDMFQVLNFRLP